MYIAHVREHDKEIQPLKTHLLGVQRLAEQFGEKLGLKHVAGLAGLLHDLGKYSDKFQEYINIVAFHPELPQPKRGEVDHSTAGGRLLFSLLHHIEGSFYEKLLAEIVGNAIISHHSNLQDYLSPDIESDYLRRVQDKTFPEYELAIDRFFKDTISREELIDYMNAAVDELEQFTDHSPTQSFFVTKYIFSCLIDADRTDTQRFEEQNETEESIQHLLLFEDYYDRLLAHLATLREKSNASEPINVLRAHMSEQCDTFAAERRPAFIRYPSPQVEAKHLPVFGMH